MNTGLLLMTQRIPLDGSAAALRPCRYCGSVHGVLTGPRGPHREGVRCADCERHLGWLPAVPDGGLVLLEGEG